MSKVLVLGANGQIARLAIARLSAAGHELTLVARRAERLADLAGEGISIDEGDAADPAFLSRVMPGQDVVYANLAGRNIEAQAQAVTSAMKAAGVRRLIWISTLGIYDEVPGAFGAWNHEQLDDGYLPTYAAAAAVVERSGLDYTIIRPAWLYDDDLVDYELTQKGEPFRGTEVTRASVAALVAELVNDPAQHIGESLGVNQPGTDGDKPLFMGA